MKGADKTIHRKVSPELRQLFLDNDCNIRAIERLKKVNRYYVYRFIWFGEEPTDRTKKGRQARIALLLPERKKRGTFDVPPEVKIWRGLPKEIRRIAIKQFTDWYQNGGKEKLSKK